MPVQDWHPRAASPQAGAAAGALPQLSFSLTTPLTAPQPSYMFEFLKQVCVQLLQVHLDAGAALHAFPVCLGCRAQALGW